MRQEHAAARPRRVHPRRRRGDPRSWPRGARARPRPRHGLPGVLAVPVANGERQRRLGSRGPRRARGGAHGRREPLSRADRAFRVPRPPAGRAVGRDEAAGRARTRSRVRPGGAPHGRAVRLARRADARDDAGRADRDLGAHGQDGVLRHPRHRRSGLPGRPRRRPQRTAGPDPRGGHDRASASSHRRRAQVDQLPRVQEPHLGPDPRGGDTVNRRLTLVPVCLVGLVGLAALTGPAARAADPPLIRFGHGFAAEEQVWLMTARPDLAPGQGTKYRLKFVPFQGNPERFQAYLANELDGGTAPGLAVIFARAQGLDIKIVAGIFLEADGKDWFTTAYMVKDDAPVKSVKDLKGGTAGVLGFKTATDLWVRAALLDAGLVPDRDVKVVPIPFPAMGGAVRTDKVSLGTFVEPFYSAEAAKGGLRTLFTAVKAVGYDHELLDLC